MTRNAEQMRLDQARDKQTVWKKWGPYLSERQWGTVREDYSDNGDAWQYFSHDEARSRAYRWGEDGIAGISDDRQRLCFAFALWNGKDPILKERLFGLTNSEGNHGEDVKEYYFYLDSTPTHSYMRYLYKYPQAAYPYDQIVAVNRQRSRNELEYELIDTGVFDQDRYFDVFIEYCKASPEDVLIRATIANRGPDAAPLHVLPTLWFRNIWSAERLTRPTLRAADDSAGGLMVVASEQGAGERVLYCDGNPELLFTENETNNVRLFGGLNADRYVKDAFHEYVIGGRRTAVNPARIGSKAAAHYEFTVPPQQSVVVRLRLCDKPNRTADEMLGRDFDETFAARLREADEFYKDITPETSTADEARVLRQALAGMLWSKQYYFFDLNRWLDEHGANPLRGGERPLRNREWYHMVNEQVISMPDKWEYPWYAAWDLAFHCIALTAVDPDFARDQLDLMLRESYMHPSGQIPAYEWNFADVNPPVHAWAALFQHRVGLALGQPPDLEFLKRAFNKLTLNFSWWVNRKDRLGKFPRPRQHRRIRSKRAAADRRESGAGGRHCLDGHVLPEHDGAVDRAHRRRSELRGHVPQVRRAFSLDRLGDEPHRAGRNVGRGGRLLLRRATHAGRERAAAQSALDGRTASSVRDNGRRRVAARSSPARNDGAHGARSAAPVAASEHSCDRFRAQGSRRPRHRRPGERATVAPDTEPHAR
jgi:hypothetical protein